MMDRAEPPHSSGADRVSNGALAEAIASMSVGVAMFDAGQRAITINDAYCASMNMPAGSFPPGTTLESMMWLAAHRGLLGPGDPEQQVRAALAADRSLPLRLRRRMFDGRSFDLHSTPLPAGGHVVCAVEVTPLIAARTEAEAGARRLAAVIATLRLGLAAFAPDRTLLLHNSRFPELMGLPLTALNDGMSLDQLISTMREADEYATLEGAAFVAQQTAIDRREPFFSRRVRSDGSVVDVASDPLADGGWTMTLSDVSALARAEDDSRRRARMLDSILDNIPHGVAVYGPDLRVTMVNPSYRVIMPTQAITVGDHLEDMIAERVTSGELQDRDAHEFPAFRRAAVRRPTAWRRQRLNGVALDIRTAPLPDGGHMSVITDVTAQVAAETAARHRAAELDAMLASTRHGIAMFDADGRHVTSNRAAAELLGVPPGADVTTQLETHFASMRADDGGPDADAAARGRQRRFVNPAGRTLDIQADPGPAGGSVLTYTDISPFLEAEQALRRAKDAAEAASGAKTRFLATMSHELRTPLTAVIGFSDALAGPDLADMPAGEVAEFARTINESGRKLLLLVNNLLDVTRLEPEARDLAGAPFALEALVRDAAQARAPEAVAASIELAVHPMPPRIMIRGDRARLSQALDHLLSNAIKFTPAAGRIDVEAAHEAGGGIRLAIADTGIGIPDVDRDRVFEPFTQLDSGLARHFAGAGLGLYVARIVVEAHDGTVRLLARPDRGTVAEIILPASRVSLSAHAADHPSDHKETA